MQSNKRREKDLIWESLRTDIERKFVKEKQGLDEIRTWLAAQGLNVTKNQLNYRINKIWGLRNRAPRGRAAEFWRMAGQLQASTQGEGSSRPGLFVHDVDNTQRLKPRNWERQIRRHNIETHYSNYGRTSPLQGDASLQVALRSPTPERVELHIPWPQDLPWLISGIQRLQIGPAYQATPSSYGPVFDLGLFGIPHHGPRNALSRSLLTSRLAGQIPELKDGDALRRAQVVLSDRTDKALAEQVKLLLGAISNKLYMDKDQIEFLLGVIEESGLSKNPLDLRGMDATLQAASDALFQGILVFLASIPFKKDRLRYDTDRAHRLLSWLLKSGQNPDIPILITEEGNTTTGLQISLALGNGDLARELLSYHASPCGLKTSEYHRRGVYDRYRLHPMFLAIAFSQSNLNQLQSYGVSLIDELQMGPHFHSYGLANYGGVGPVPFILERFEGPATISVIQYLLDHQDRSGTPMYRGMLDWHCLLMHAVVVGNLEVLKFLLSRHDDLLGFGCSTARDLVNWADERGVSALHVAVFAKRNPIEICQHLLQNGAIFDRDSELFHLACFGGSLETIELLHRMGANINKRCNARSLLWDSFHHDRLDPSQCTPLDVVLQFRPSAMHLRFSESEVEDIAICEYLLRHGSDVPWELVDFAIGEFNVSLLSLALKSDASVVNHYEQRSGSLLYRVLKLACPVSKETRREIRFISNLLLDYGAQVRAGDAARAAFLGDWDLVTRFLDLDIHGISKISGQSPFDYFDKDMPSNEISLLESAILSGSPDIARKAFGLDPNHYDAGALCAATLMASIMRDYCLVQALLNNRRKEQVSEEQVSWDQNRREMTAVGIAARSGDWELLQLLKSQLPWSNLAVVPHAGDWASAFAIYQPQVASFRRPGFIRFWNFHTSYVGSVQIFAVEAESRIFDLFFRPGCSVDPVSIARLIELKLYDRVSLLLRGRHTIKMIVNYHSLPSPIHIAIRQGSISMVRACLDLGSDINGFSETRPDEKLDHQEKSPLTLSIEQGHQEITDLLLEKGADVNSPDAPLQAACTAGQIGIVMKLLRLGADPNLRFSYAGYTALDAAAAYGRLDIVHLLLRSGVKTEGSGRFQYLRATRSAFSRCHIQVYKLLKGHRAWTKRDRILWNHPHSLYKAIYKEDNYEGDSGDERDLNQELNESGSEYETDSEPGSGWEPEGDSDDESDLNLEDDRPYLGELENGERDLEPMDIDSLSETPEGRSDMLSRHEISDGFDGPVDQRRSTDIISGGSPVTTDPFFGYQRGYDMPDTSERIGWDDLDYI
ncbi:ankyrin [Apiospora sp. TS-2023a]